MKLKKLMLPMMAFVFAIGLSFAAVNPEPESKALANDYILINGSWEAIPEQSCANGPALCQVQFGENGPIYEVYDEMDTSTLKDSDTEVPTVIIR